MNVSIIHKGIKNTSSVRNYLSERDDYKLEELSLHSGAFNCLREFNPDVIIFDSIVWRGEIMDSDYIKEIRKIKPNTPILLATASTETASYREQMLDEGVDGCIQVPFLADELHLRIMKLAAKKNSLLFTGTTIGSDDVVMDIRTHEVKEHGNQVSLTKTEYSILLHLFLHKNVLVSNKELSVCLRDADEESLALSIHIFNLRKKIKTPELIRTIPLYGFTISDHKIIV